MTLYDRDGKQVFTAADGRGSNLAPPEALAAMCQVDSFYLKRDGHPYIHTRVPVVADGSIPGYTGPLQAAQPQAVMSMEHGAAPNNAPTQPVASHATVGLITLEQDMQDTTWAIQKIQWTMGSGLIGLMSLLFWGGVIRNPAHRPHHYDLIYPVTTPARYAATFGARQKRDEQHAGA